MCIAESCPRFPFGFSQSRIEHPGAEPSGLDFSADIQPLLRLLSVSRGWRYNIFQLLWLAPRHVNAVAKSWLTGYVCFSFRFSFLCKTTQPLQKPSCGHLLSPGVSLYCSQCPNPSVDLDFGDHSPGNSRKLPSWGSSQPVAKWHCFAAILSNAAVLSAWLKVDCSTPPQLHAAFHLVVDSSRTILFLAISVVSLFLWRTCEALAVYRPDFAKSCDDLVVCLSTSGPESPLPLNLF